MASTSCWSGCAASRIRCPPPSAPATARPTTPTGPRRRPCSPPRISSAWPSRSTRRTTSCSRRCVRPWRATRSWPPRWPATAPHPRPSSSAGPAPTPTRSPRWSSQAARLCSRPRQTDRSRSCWPTEAVRLGGDW